VLTVLTVSSALVLTLIILVPIRPSRQNVISMPRVRRNVCVRRRRPASARGLFVPGVPLENSSRAVSAHKRNRSDALPVHIVRLAIIVRTQLAMGSASMISRRPLSDWLYRREQKCRRAKRPFRMRRPRARSRPCAADARDPSDCWRASHAPSRRGVHPRCRDGRFRIGAKGPPRDADLRRQWALRSERWPDH
jgi:hypothetical protein